MNLTHYWKRAIILAVMIALGSGASAPVFADNLNITGGVPGVACTNSSVTSGSLAFACPASPLSGVLTSSGAGDLSTAVFGAATEVSGVTFTTGGQTSADVFVTYNFSVTGVTNGTAQFDISAPGIIGCGGCSSFPGGQAFGYFIDGNGESINGAPPGLATSTPLSNGANELVVDTSINNGTTDLFFGLEIGTSCGSVGDDINPGTPCTASSDFLDPMSVTGATVYDANGNLVTNASLVSESGFNPNAGTAVPAPEPTSLPLLGLGLVALIGLRKRAIV